MSGTKISNEVRDNFKNIIANVEKDAVLMEKNGIYYDTPSKNRSTTGIALQEYSNLYFKTVAESLGLKFDMAFATVVAKANNLSEAKAQAARFLVTKQNKEEATKLFDNIEYFYLASQMDKQFFDKRRENAGKLFENAKYLNLDGKLIESYRKEANLPKNNINPKEFDKYRNIIRKKAFDYSHTATFNKKLGVSTIRWGAPLYHKPNLTEEEKKILDEAANGGPKERHKMYDLCIREFLDFDINLVKNTDIKYLADNFEKLSYMQVLCWDSQRLFSEMGQDNYPIDKDKMKAIKDYVFIVRNYLNVVGLQYDFLESDEAKYIDFNNVNGDQAMTYMGVRKKDEYNNFAGNLCTYAFEGKPEFSALIDAKNEMLKVVNPEDPVRSNYAELKKIIGSDEERINEFFKSRFNKTYADDIGETLEKTTYIKNLAYVSTFEKLEMNKIKNLDHNVLRNHIISGESDEAILNSFDGEKEKLRESLPLLRQAIKLDNENQDKYYKVTKEQIDKFKLPEGSKKEIERLGKACKLPMFSSKQVEENKKNRDKIFNFYKQNAMDSFGVEAPIDRTIGNYMINPKFSIEERNEIARKCHNPENLKGLYEEILDEVLSIDESYIKPFTMDEYFGDFKTNEYYRLMTFDPAAIGKMQEFGILTEKEANSYKEYTQFICGGLNQGKLSGDILMKEEGLYIDTSKITPEMAGEAFTLAQGANSNPTFNDFIVKNMTNGVEKIDEKKIPSMLDIKKNLLISRISKTLLEKPNISEEEKDFIKLCMDDKVNGGMKLYEHAINEIMEIDNKRGQKKSKDEVEYENHLMARGKHLLNAMKLDGYIIDQERLDDINIVLKGDSPRIVHEIEDLKKSEDPIKTTREALASMFAEVSSELNDTIGKLNNGGISKEDGWKKIKESLATMITLKINDNKVVNGGFDKNDVEPLQFLSSKDNVKNIRDALLVENKANSIWQTTMSKLGPDTLQSLANSTIKDEVPINKLIESYEMGIGMKVQKGAPEKNKEITEPKLGMMQ